MSILENLASLLYFKKISILRKIYDNLSHFENQRKFISYKNVLFYDKNVFFFKYDKFYIFKNFWSFQKKYEKYKNIFIKFTTNCNFRNKFNIFIKLTINFIISKHLI